MPECWSGREDLNALPGAKRDAPEATRRVRTKDGPHKPPTTWIPFRRCFMLKHDVFPSFPGF